MEDISDLKSPRNHDRICNFADNVSLLSYLTQIFGDDPELLSFICLKGAIKWLISAELISGFKNEWLLWCIGSGRFSIFESTKFNSNSHFPQNYWNENLPQNLLKSRFLYSEDIQYTICAIWKSLGTYLLLNNIEAKNCKVKF